MTVRLSYSTLTTFRSCERKFAMRKIYAKDEPWNDTPATNLGSAVGTGYQNWLANGRDYNLGLVALWAHYTHGLEDKTRTIFRAIEAYEAMIAATPEEWSIATFNGKPAIELSFCINCGVMEDGIPITYVGYLDGVLNSFDTLSTLELKTTALAGNVESNYKNSSQGVGYSIICTAIAKAEGLLYNAESSTANYLVAQLPRAKSADVVALHYPFRKSLSDRLDFLLTLRLDVDSMKELQAIDYFPKRGTACRQYARDCAYYGMCDLTGDQAFQEPDTTEYDFTFELEDLIEQTVAELQGVPL